MGATTDAGGGSVIPGEVLAAEGTIELNEGADALSMTVVNTGDRPVQVGSHVHFPQANAALDLDRAAARGRRLDIPAGTAVRFEPGIEMAVTLIPLGGGREVHGISLDPPGRIDGPTDAPTGSDPSPEGAL